MINKPTTFLFDNPNYQDIETWNKVNLSYKIFAGFVLQTNLKWVEASDITAYNKIAILFLLFLMIYYHLIRNLQFHLIIITILV